MLFLSVLAILSVASLAGETFRNPRHIPTGQDPVSLAVGDLNGDGQPDIIYGTTPYTPPGNNPVGVLRSLLAQPDGTYADAADINLPGGISSSCRLADFNGDGKLDLLCTTVGSSGNAVAFAQGNGDGTFRSFVQSSLPAAADTQYIAAAGDINNDGHTDAILTDAQNNLIFVLLGDGSGHFSASLLTSSATGAGEAVLKDLNGDGNLDLLEVNTLSNDVSVFLGNGNGSFQNPVRYIGMQSIVLADADGRPDLISGGEGQLTILHGNADGTFNTTPIVNINYSTGTNIKTGYAEYLHAFAFQDLNGDGIPDVLCGADDGLTTIMGKPGL